MKNKKRGYGVWLFLIILLVAIITAVLCVISISKREDSRVVKQNSIYDEIYNKEENITEIESKYTNYTFDTAYGKVKIDADKALQARGTAGASNYIFYIKDSSLYLKKDDTGVDRKYANGVDDIYYEDERIETITVKLNASSTLSNENSYLEYIK